MTTTKTVEDYYDQIELAATKAAPLFHMFGWTHAMSDVDSNGLIGSITGLIEDCIKYFNKYPDERTASVSSGRFTVMIREYDDERELNIYLDLASSSEFKDFQ